MKTLLLIFLLTLSLIASQKEHVRKIPGYMIDEKNYGLIDSKKAFFVIGSPKYGTMKDNFAFAKKEDAQKYVKERGGCVVNYEEYINMTDEDVEAYVKKHGIVIEKKEDNNTTKTKVDINNTGSDIYNKENLKKYKF